MSKALQQQGVATTRRCNSKALQQQGVVHNVPHQRETKKRESV